MPEPEDPKAAPPGSRANPAEAVRPSASRAVGLARKPSGCLHSHIEGGDTAPQGLPSIPSTPASAQGSVVDRLVEVVRRLGE